MPVEKQDNSNIYFTDVDLNYIESLLTDFNNINNIANYDQNQVKQYFTFNAFQERLKSDVEVSESVGQNIIYRIAKEIHGYT